MSRPLLIRIAAVLVGACLLFEFSVRVLLFSNVAAGLSVAAELRKPQRFAHAQVEDLYWLLEHEFEGSVPGRLTDFDPRLGWVGSRITPRDYSHSDASLVGDRRPVLLYGDSFASCVTLPGACFEDLLEASDLGPTHKLLNYGVSGYGLDQIALLVESTLGGYAGREPLVVVGVFVDDDLDRCALSVRGYPKPRLAADGSFPLVGWEMPAPPALESYGLRLVLHSSLLTHSRVHTWLCPRDRLERENRVRTGEVLTRLAGTLERSGVEAFFVLFNGRHSIDRPEATGWREGFLRESLDAHGIPWVSARGAFLAHARQSGRPVSDYYLRDGHLNARGNHTAFLAIRDGLRGRFGELEDYEFSEEQLRGPLLTADNIDEVVLGGPHCSARYELNSQPPFTAADERSRLTFRQVGRVPTELHYRAAGRVERFTATAKFIPMGKLGPGVGSMGLTLLADGEVLSQQVLRRGGAPLMLDVDLSGRESFVVRVDGAGDGRRGDWLMLASPAFH